MCDYSLQTVRSRPARVGDKLTTHQFNTGTIGFAAPEDDKTAVCVLPGTELAFATAIRCMPCGLFGWKTKVVNHTTAIFRQINKDNLHTHHDALEFPDGQIVLLTDLFEHQEATVLQLPAQPRSRGEGPGTGRARRLSHKLGACLGRPQSGGLFCEILDGRAITDNGRQYLDVHGADGVYRLGFRCRPRNYRR
jgi:hypothetical protein